MIELYGGATEVLKYQCATCCTVKYVEQNDRGDAELYWRSAMRGWAAIKSPFDPYVCVWCCPDCDSFEIDGRHVRVGAVETLEKRKERRFDWIALTVVSTLLAFIMGGLIL